MHNGDLAATLAAEIQAAGGVVTEADLASVQPQVRLHRLRDKHACGVASSHLDRSLWPVTCLAPDSPRDALSAEGRRTCDRAGLWLGLRTREIGTLHKDQTDRGARNDWRDAALRAGEAGHARVRVRHGAGVPAAAVVSRSHRHGAADSGRCSFYASPQPTPPEALHCIFSG